jgi:pyruvate dehydrogenase E1 component alpha subunit
VPAFRGRLVADGVLTGEEAAAIAEEVRAELQAAVDFGLQSAFPEVETALEYTYA